MSVNIVYPKLLIEGTEDCRETNECNNSNCEHRIRTNILPGSLIDQPIGLFRGLNSLPLGSDEPPDKYPPEKAADVPPVVDHGRHTQYQIQEYYDEYSLQLIPGNNSENISMLKEKPCKGADDPKNGAGGTHRNVGVEGKAEGDAGNAT